MNLKWDALLKKIREDPNSFIYKEGGWRAFFEDSDEVSEESESDADSEFKEEDEKEESEEDDSEYDEEELNDSD